MKQFTFSTLFKEDKTLNARDLVGVIEAISNINDTNEGKIKTAHFMNCSYTQCPTHELMCTVTITFKTDKDIYKYKAYRAKDFSCSNVECRPMAFSEVVANHIANGSNTLIISDGDNWAYGNGFATWLQDNYKYTNKRISFEVNLLKPLK